MHLFRVLLIVTTAGVLLSSCGPLCRSRGGRYISVHRGTKQICDMPAKDTGKACRSYRDCETYCRCPRDIEERLRRIFAKRKLLTDKLPSTATTGKCQRFSFRGGFQCKVEGGKAVSDFILID